jgi:hypothetical protein
MFFAVAFLNYDVAPQDKNRALARPACGQVVGATTPCPWLRKYVLYCVTNNVPLIIFCLQLAEKLAL